MRKFLEEFREFINRGSVMDMAVGVIIGSAFTSIVTALTDNIITPIITLVTGGTDKELTGLVVPGTNIDFGKFIAAVINFFIVAAVVFLLVRFVNRAKRLGEKLAHREKKAEAPKPTCPFCLEEIKPGATRCPHCAAELPKPAAAPEATPEA
jgi:large conductance mechanosensitive channel